MKHVTQESIAAYNYGGNQNKILYLFQARLNPSLQRSETRCQRSALLEVSHMIKTVLG